MNEIEWTKEGGDYKARGNLGEDEFGTHWDALVEKGWKAPWLVEVRFFEDAWKLEREDEFDEITIRGFPGPAEAKRHVETILHVWKQTMDKFDRALEKL